MRIFLVLALLAVPAATAQGIATASLPVQANNDDLGADPPCLVLDMGQTAAAGAQPFDLRLTPCLGHAPGTEIQSSDTIELQATYPQAHGATPESVLYADLDANGRYSPGDSVYLTSQTGPGLMPTTGTAAWTVRLTSVDGFPAGSLVRAGDADLAAFGPSAQPWAAASLGWLDADNSVTYTPGDIAFLMPVAPGTSAGTQPPVGSIRVSGATPASTSSPTQAPTSTSPTRAVPSPTAMPAAPSGTTSMDASKGTPGTGFLLGLLVLGGVASRRSRLQAA